MRACVSLALLACTLPYTLAAQATAPDGRAGGSSPRRANARRRAVGSGSDVIAPGSPQQSALPVTRVSLYKNGVGFFEHATRITGEGTVTLELTSAQLDDALETLTAVDLGGGRITGANYNSTTPLAQQLGNLPFSLGPNPGEDDLYTALRGAEVQITGSGPAFQGRVLSLAVRDGVQAADTENVQGKSLPERRMLTVVAGDGATRTLELTPATVVRVLDGRLRGDLNNYLRLLDRNRSQDVRRLTLTDYGSGSRELRVSFLSEVPVWKSTYRVLFTTGAGAAPQRAKTATLQGYSVVDNTTGEDWNGVQLSLVAGSPQSFVQPLAQPIYDRRPEVPIAENAQLTPQTHDSGIGPEAPSPAPSSATGGNPNSMFGSAPGTEVALAGRVNDDPGSGRGVEQARVQGEAWALGSVPRRVPWAAPWL